MLKGALQRHAQLGHVLRRQLSTTALSGARLQTRVQPQATTLRLASLVRLQSAIASQIAIRHYSAEATATAEKSNPATQGLITKFRDLTQLGVHPALIESITQGMRYESMTDVQALTINSALNGVDL